MLPDLAPGVLERAGGPPKLSKEVQDTIDANKAIAAVTVVSQPSTPALGPTSVPATPVNLSVAQRLVAETGPSNPTSPTLIRAHSEPLANTQEHVQKGEAAGSSSTSSAASSSATAAAAAAIAAASSSPLSPLVLDEGLRQRQGRVVISPTPAVAAAPAAATGSSAVPAPAAAAVANRPLVPVAAPAQPLSSVTVFLALLILLILARKLYASVNSKPSFSYDFSQD